MSEEEREGALMSSLPIEERMEQLIDRYVVVTKSRKNGRFMFYINKELRGTITSKWWSTFLENAKGFVSMKDALDLAWSLKYNSPTVYKVCVTGSDFGPIYDIKKCL